MDQKKPSTGAMFFPIIAMFAVIMVFPYLPPIFTPIIYAIFGLGGKYPIVTVFLAALLTGIVSTVVRHIFTDYIATARIQHVMGAFQKELRAAQLKRDMNRIKKLQEYQQELLLMQTISQSGQMKSMLPTMLVSIPIFAGLLGMISGYSDPFTKAWIPPILDQVSRDAPWGSITLSGRWFLFPNYIWVYMIFSILIGSVIGRALRLIKFSKYEPKEGIEAIVPAPAPAAPIVQETESYMNLSDSKFKKWAAKRLKEKGYAVYRDAQIAGTHVDLIVAGDSNVYGFICRSLPGVLDMKTKTYRDETGMELFDVSEELAKVRSALSGIQNAMINVKLLVNGRLKNADEDTWHYRKLEEMPQCQNPMTLEVLGRPSEPEEEEQ